MRSLAGFNAVFLHREPIDMRKSLDGLSAVVRNEMEKVLDARYLFVFVGRSRDRMKLLYWDKTGYALWYKRLERARFPWPKSGEAVLEISPHLLEYLLEGVDIFIVPHAEGRIGTNRSRRTQVSSCRARLAHQRARASRRLSAPQAVSPVL